jgi:energy-coupling factor transport system ATP-binding protein
MELMGLNGLADREPATLSGGQKQLLALAAVLALQPQTLILDEPTSDLDPWRVEDLLQTLEILRQRENLAMVLLGQDLRLTEHSDRIILLSEGKVVAEGKPGEILRQVETFRRLGLQPHPLAALFFDLGQADLPLDLNAAAALGRRLGWDNPDPPPAAASGPVAGPEILALRQVDFGYPERPLLWEKLSLSFYQGEIVAILGANGSGKTTLLKLLRGLLHPQAGELWIRPDSEQSGGPARLGFVFQNPDYQIFAEEVGEEVAFGPRQLGLSETEVKGRVDQALSQVHLLDQAAEDPFSLTKGQRQRLAVAAVLAMAPALIILDEPTTGLDHGGQMGMMELIRELNQRGHTIIMVTHSMWAAAAYASRLIIMQEGRIILDGPTREVLSQEEALAGCNLFPPLVTRLARLLGWSALTAAEFLGRVKGRQHDRRN